MEIGTALRLAQLGIKAVREETRIRYEATEDFAVDFRVRPGTKVDLFIGEWISIVESPEGPGWWRFIVRKGFRWDGATGAPETPESPYWSIVHDALYEELDAISKVWGVPVSQVRRLADDMLFAHCDKLQVKRRGVIYTVVRVVGGVFHSLSRWFLPVLVCLSLSACRSAYRGDDIRVPAPLSYSNLVTSVGEP